jgi:hypothetical membrane protein
MTGGYEKLRCGFDEPLREDARRGDARYGRPFVRHRMPSWDVIISCDPRAETWSAAFAEETALQNPHRPIPRRANAGAVLWICCLQYFAAEALAIGGWRGSYSLSRNYISDLGALDCAGPNGAAEAVCSPLHALMNASFVLQGALIVCGTALVAPRFPKRGLWRTALWLVGASGIGVLGVGLAPEDAVPGAHFLAAIENFLCCNFGMAIMGTAMLNGPPAMRKVGLITFGAGLSVLRGSACSPRGPILASASEASSASPPILSRYGSPAWARCC